MSGSWLPTPRERLTDLGELSKFGGRVLRDVYGGRVLRYFGEVLRQSGILILSSTLVIWGLVFILGLQCGIEGAYFLRAQGTPQYAGLFSAWCDLRELVPYAFGYMMAAKVGTGLVAELGSMRISDEIDALEVMGIDSVLFLCATRLLAAWMVLPFVYMAGVGAPTDGGQNVSDTFHRADFFMNAWDKDVAQKDIERTLRIIFGDPYRTPTRDEHGQFMAAGAARRSAELGRQVGAAIVHDGSIIAVGTNEVPRYKGGSHWEEDGDGNREFEVSKIDTNRVHQKGISKKIAGALDNHFDRALEKAGVRDPDERQRLREALSGELPAKLLNGGLKEITEFGRAVHAEMSAVLDAAQRGVAIYGCTVYTTTFPCHNCARHLVGAGIERVVFVEPYPKSQAGDLHGDSIAIGMTDVEDAVSFASFVGVAPRRYLSVFDAVAREKLAGQPRKTEEHEVRQFVKGEAIPLFPDLEPEEFRPLLPAYRLKELIALSRFNELREQHRGPRATQREQPDEPPIRVQKDIAATD